MRVTSDVKTTQRDSIHIDPDYHELYSQLTTGSDAPFKTMKDMFMLATSLGFARGRRTPLSGQREIFRWPVFSSQEDIPVLRAIAISETGNSAVLVDQDQLLTIAEEYANAGITDVRRYIANQPGLPLESLVEMLLQ